MSLKLANWDRNRLRLLGLALVAAAIMHIVATLAAPYVNTATAYTRLSGRLPTNSFLLLPAVTPSTQHWPFQLPDFRYSVCRFDASLGPVQVRANLIEPGWILSVVSAAGDNVYSVQSQERSRSDVNLLLVPPGERFDRLVGDGSGTSVSVPLPGATGLVVIRAPMAGNAFLTRTEQALASGRCTAARN